MPLAAGTRLGPYQILGLIGAGRMGEVYKAHDTGLDRSIAIRVLPAEISADAERRARLEREAKTRPAVFPFLGRNSFELATACAEPAERKFCVVC